MRTEQKTVSMRIDGKSGQSAQISGRVWLVGAGPGAPDLITKRGYDLLMKADVVVYDALILPETLEMIPDHTEKIYVGKRAGAHSVPQEEIQKILIREARAGKQVVRLKGGDPFVFGRGGEEALALAAQGIPCEVVPGVTSAVAVPEAFGIPVTHRGMATSFTVITGHGQAVREDPGQEDRPECGRQPASAAAGPWQTEVTPAAAEPAGTYRIDYEALVRTGGTLIFLMGLGAAGSICRGLMDAGLAPSVPAAALSKGTTASQRMILSDVGRLPGEIRNAGLEAPAILVVGDVCVLAQVLGRTGGGKSCESERQADSETDAGERPEERNSAGNSLTVVVTAQEEKAEAFSEKIRAMGMTAFELPAIRIRRPGEAAVKEAISALRKLCGITSADCEEQNLSRSDEKAEESGSPEGQAPARPDEKTDGQEKPVWLVFTSANGVHAFFDLLTDAGMDMRSLLRGSRKNFAAVGQRTAEALKGYGILADLVPEEQNAAALGEALGLRIEEENGRNRSGCRKNPRVWFFGAAKTDGGLEAALEARNISFQKVPVYETVSAVNAAGAERLAEQMARGERFIFTFTSASGVRNLVAALKNAETAENCLPARKKTEARKRESDRKENEAGSGRTDISQLLRGQTAVCIGEKTAKAAEEAGMRTVIAKESTEAGMLEAVRLAADLCI